ncbi:hypothetical protein JCM11641_002033 [Rhodosporidiobolus odoratus]
MRNHDARTNMQSFRIRWASLVHQAGKASGQAGRETEKGVAAVLIDLLKASASPAPIILDYVQGALGSPSDLGQPRMLRPGLLARQAITGALSASTIETVFTFVNAALSASPEEPVESSSSAQEVAQATLLVLDNLLPLVSSTALSQTARWISHFLSRPPHRISKKKVSADLLEQCKVALKRAIEALPAGREVQLKADLQTALSRLSSGGRRRVASPVARDDEGRLLTYEPDAVMLASRLISLPHTPAATLVSQTQSYLNYRLAQSPFRDSAAEVAYVRGLADLLLPMLKAVTGMERQDKVIEGAVFAKLPYMLRAVAEKHESSELGAKEDFPSALAQAIRLVKSANSSSSVGDAMDVDGSSSLDSLSAATDKLVVALCQQEVYSPDVGASIATTVERSDLESVQLVDYSGRLAGGDPEQLKQILEELVSNLPAQRAISGAICESIHSLASSSPPDLHNLASFCETLSQDADVLGVLLLHIQPRQILAPLRRVIDDFDPAQSDFSEENSTERYGTLVVFVQLVVARFGLDANLAYHLGSASSFLVGWLPSSAATYPLSILSDEERTAVSGWIAALFGEGISDDLMHATDPRMLLRVAPTILKQSLMACQAGVVDFDILRDALSYFLQELLRFTLPGVLTWLIEEIARTPPSTHHNNMLDILQVFIFSDQLPSPVLELIAPHLVSLLSNLPKAIETQEKSVDRVKLRKLIMSFRQKEDAVNWAEVEAQTDRQALLDILSSSIDSPLTSAPPPNLFNAASLTLSSPSLATSRLILRDILLPHFLSLATSTSSKPDSTADTPSEIDTLLRYSRLERAGSALLAFSPPSHSPSFSSAAHTNPLVLDFLSATILPSFSHLAQRVFPLAPGVERERDRVNLALLADMLAGALVMVDAQDRVLEAGGGEGRTTPVEKVLTRLMVEARRAMEEAKQDAKRLGRNQDDEDAETALTVFLRRLVSWNLVEERCTGLAELVEA